MKSHLGQFTWKELIAITGLPGLVVALFALAMHGGAASGILPPPRPIHDPDRTILLHQADASRKRHAATMVLIGDSSCLMNVSVPVLNELLRGGLAFGARALDATNGTNGTDGITTPPRTAAINLGTLSYLNLDDFALILRHFFAANPAGTETVVLLMHPEALRRTGVSDYHRAVLRDSLESSETAPSGEFISRLLGLRIFRDRILARAVPQPLPGAFGRKYGFAADLWRHLSENGGSALDPNTFNPAGATPLELRLAPALQSASGRFRESLPPGTRLLAGITPVPESFAPPDHALKHREALERWGNWLRADGILETLPAILPDASFATSTHLNADGVARYTQELARALVSFREPDRSADLR